ncbi:MAG: DUF3830 family protein [Acidobacteriota bacterium]
MRKIRITFTEAGVSADARLLDEKAPRTCAAIWSQLKQPLEVGGTHAMWTGPEVSLQVPPPIALPDLRLIPPENQTVFPAKGALLWCYQPAYAFAGLPFELFDIGLFYDSQARIFLPMGWVPCNHFASLLGEWDSFGECCRRTRREGARQVRMQRL